MAVTRVRQRAPSRSQRGVGDRFRGPEARRTRRRRRTRARRRAPGPRAVPRRRALEARARPAAARAGSTFRSPTKASSGPRRRSAPPARRRRPTAPSPRPGAPPCRVERLAAISRRRSRRARGTSPRRTPAPSPRNHRIHACPRWDGRAARRGTGARRRGRREAQTRKFRRFRAAVRRDSREAMRMRHPRDAHKSAAFADTGRASRGGARAEHEANVDLSRLVAERSLSKERTSFCSSGRESVWS
jgi:hypothetical protein